jgi:hypothetical protein
MYYEAGRILLTWFEHAPLAQITLNLNGTSLLIILLAIGAYWGYQQGFRNLLTIAFWTIAAYIATVQGGNFLVQIINRFWQNGPRLVAFAIGQDPGAAPVFEPLITAQFQIPLFFRFAAFIALVLLGFFFSRNAGWKGDPNEPLAKPLGLFVGALVMLLWSNAMKIFWEQFVADGGGFGGPLANVLNTLPNVGELTTSLIVIFFLIIIALIFVYFPKIWKASGGSGGGGGGGGGGPKK